MIRKTELYKMIVESKNVNKEDMFDELSDIILLDDFLEYFYNKNIYKSISTNVQDSNTNNNETESSENDEVATDIMSNESLTLNKVDIKSRKLCYYIKSINEVINNDETEDTNKIRNVIMEYVKYAKQLKVVDKNTLEKKFEKTKNEGDLEKQHYLIKTFHNYNRALLVWEKILGAVSLGFIEKKLNSSYREWIKEKYKNNKEVKNSLLSYHIKIYPIPSKDFLNELDKLEKISLLKVTVTKEGFSLDEDIMFSENNISKDEVDLIYKPCQGLSFSKSKIKKYIKNCTDNDNVKNKVKRIFIKGKSEGNIITLNTELIKMNQFIEIKEDSHGLVDSDDLFDKYTNLVYKNSTYLDEIFIDIDMDDMDIDT